MRKKWKKRLNIVIYLLTQTKCGQEMIDDFLEEHREVRLIKIRLKDKGVDFMQDNKKKMLSMFENMEISVTKKLRSDLARN